MATSFQQLVADEAREAEDRRAAVADTSGKPRSSFVVIVECYKEGAHAKLMLATCPDDAEKQALAACNYPGIRIPWRVASKPYGGKSIRKLD